MTLNLTRCFSELLNILRYVALKLALVPVSHYNCDVKQSNLNVCAKFH